MDLNKAAKTAEDLAWLQVAERCKVDLFYLCKYILGYDIIEPFAHGPLCSATRPLLFWQDKEKAKQYEFPSDWGRDEDEGLPTDEEKQEFYKRVKQFIPGDPDDAYKPEDKLELSLHELMILMPRGTLKSSVITIGFTIQWFLNHPDSRVLLDSETFTKSSAFLTEIKGHFEGNDSLRRMFFLLYGTLPDSQKRNVKWSDSAITLSCRKKSRKEASIECAGVDVTKNGMHYDLIIFDDLHSELNTKTKDQIEKVIEHFKLAYSLLDPGCPTIVIGTRWSYTDVYQYILDNMADDFNLITRAAKADDGDLLFPNRLTTDFLKAQRSKQGSYIFSCQYMNNPVDAETATFRREWFQYKSLKEIEGIPMNWYLTVDPGGDGENSDYAAFVLSGVDYMNQLYVRHIVRAKLSQGQIVNKTFDLYREFQPRQIVVETLASAGKSIEYTYKERQRDQEFWLPIKYITGRSRMKSERIETLAPKYEEKKVYHIRECPEIRQLEEELIHFPKAKFDDVSDALATVLEVARPPSRNKANEEVRQRRKRRIKKLNTPRSPMVGY